MSCHKNIVIAPCGNKSTFFKTHWLKEKHLKEFDLCLLFYHPDISNPEQYGDAEYFFHLRDFKFRMIHQLLTSIAPQLLEKYDRFYFIDDDIAFETADINQMFRLSQVFNTSISQASLSQDSFFSWPILKNQPDCVLRWLGQIEVMAPLFSREALLNCLPSFTANRSSWGYDSVWSKLLGYPKNKIAVFDEVIMHHANPVGGGELYIKIGVDPYKEWQEITEQYGATAINYVEHGRLMKVDAQTNSFFFRLKKGQLKMTDLVMMVKNRRIKASVKHWYENVQRNRKYNLRSVVKQG